jgi:membrane protein YqaA with SNARE-associated domain
MQSASYAQQAFGWFEQFDEWLKGLALQYGYLGIFLVSLIGASSIIIPIPYTILIFWMGKILDPVLVAISVGIGSAMGEFFGYFLGYYGRALVNDERKRKMDYILKVFRRYGDITIFIFALTPLPDDLLIIPLGIMHYNFLRAFVPYLLGKTLMCFILAYSGRLSIGFIENILGEGGGFWTTITTTALLIIIMVVLFKVDWEKIFPMEEKKKEQKKIQKTSTASQYDPYLI